MKKNTPLILLQSRVTSFVMVDNLPFFFYGNINLI